MAAGSISIPAIWEKCGESVRENRPEPQYVSTRWVGILRFDDPDSESRASLDDSKGSERPHHARMK